MTFEEFLKFIAELSKYLSGGVVGGILGYLLKTQIDHRLAIARNYETIRATEFNKAAAIFRAAFVDAVFALQRSVRCGGKDANNILIEPVITAHEKAKIMFEPYLPSTSIGSFNAVWNEYRKGKYDYAAKIGESFNIQNTDHSKGLSEHYLSCIQKLLEFAQPKTST